MAINAAQIWMYRGFAGAPKGFDLQVLFKRLEEKLNLPSVLIYGRDRGGPEFKVIG